MNGFLGTRKIKHTTTLFFQRHRGPQPFPRWTTSYYDDCTDAVETRTFRTKAGCRWFARRLGRNAGWLA